MFIIKLLLKNMNLIFKLKSTIISFRFRNDLKQNKKIQNIHKDESYCFIIGAGPSLKNIDTSKLENEIILGMNAVYLNESVRKVPKKYWIIIDYFFMHPLPIDAIKAIEDGVGEAVYFLPVQAKAICKKYNLFQNKKVYYFFFSDFASDYRKITDEQLDLSSVILKPRGSTETAIICAYYLGFKKIYLLGVDSDWFAHKSADGNHFYVETSNKHSIDDKITDWIDHTKMESKLFYGYVLYKSYRLLWLSLRSRGIEVYNASGGGLLDVFPIVDYDKIFETPKSN